MKWKKRTDIDKPIPELFNFSSFPYVGALDLPEDPNEDEVFNREEVVTPKDITVHEDTFSSGGGGHVGSHDQSHDPLILQDLSDQASSEAIPLSDLVIFYLFLNELITKHKYWQVSCCKINTSVYFLNIDLEAPVPF